MIPLTSSDRQRARLLTAGRRRATGLLVVVAVIFVLATTLGHRASWLAWVQAVAVASLVGGLADWFAVTALFRRPLGLPIPHTAIVVERKDRFAETLGAFVQESFLTPAAVSQRLRASAAVPRVAAWLADPTNADLLAARLAAGAAAGAELLREDEVQDLLHSMVRERVERLDLAPLAGRALGGFTAGAHHEGILDLALAGLGRYITEHGPDLHHRLGADSPWWLPGPVEERLVERLLVRTTTVLHQMAEDRRHPLRQQLDEALAELSQNLQRSPELRRRGEEIKAQLLNQPELREFITALWRDTKIQLRAEAATPGSALRRRVSELAVRSGQRLRDDPALAAAALRSLDTVVGGVLGQFEGELSKLVSGTIQRWDASETSQRLELLLGPDLQYIRINGTVVGGLAGLALHAAGRLLG
ncbi:MAG: DUF445 domain-containing protein [Acidimicrobiales bacterium]